MRLIITVSIAYGVTEDKSATSITNQNIRWLEKIGPKDIPAIGNHSKDPVSIPTANESRPFPVTAIRRPTYI